VPQVALTPVKRIARPSRWLNAHTAATFIKVASHPGVQVTVFFSLLLLRSSARLFHPQVWDEDGTRNIFDFVHHGLGSLFSSVNGYLLLIPKCITLVSLSVSFSYYPLISTVVAWGIILAALVVVASPRTQLRGGLLLGALALIVPTDIEVFGLPSYTFWWATLAVFAVILWEKNSTDLKWRLPVVVLTGLSSPVIIGVAPFFLLRSVLYRKVWQEWIISSSAVVCALVQFLVWKSWAAQHAPPVKLTAAKVAQIIPKFFGRYLVGNLLHSSASLWVAGVIVLAFLTFLFVRYRQSTAYWLTAGLLIASIAMVAGRVDISIIHPVLAGQRYFFFPFVLVSWCLLQATAGDKSWYWRLISSLLIALSVLNAVPVITRVRHDDLHWREHVLSCPFFARYLTPIEYNGRADMAWELDLTGAECRSLLRHDLLIAWRRRPLTFPYAVLPYVPAADSASFATRGSVIRNEWADSARPQDRLAGMDTLTSFRSAPPGAQLTLRLRRGQAVLYRSGPLTTHLKVLINGGTSPFLQLLPPLPAWSVLSFSNSMLPEQFTVTFIAGRSPADWVAIGLARPSEP
jgi:hypothetical protein